MNPERTTAILADLATNNKLRNQRINLAEQFRRFAAKVTGTVNDRPAGADNLDNELVRRESLNQVNQGEE